MRFFGGFLVIVAIVAFAWIVSLPDQAECVASGRTVDPTERHCVSVTGYEQLQGHATFHATQVALVVSAVLAGGYVVRRYLRRGSSGGAPAA